MQVSVVDDKYHFDGVEATSYRVGPHTYRFENIPTSKKLGWRSTSGTTWKNAFGNMNSYVFRYVDGVLDSYRWGVGTDAVNLIVGPQFVSSYFEPYSQDSSIAISYDATCTVPDPPSPPPPLPPSPPPPACLPGTVAVTVVNQKYYFDGVEAGAYSVGEHTYTFTGVPSDHKMAWMGSPANTDWNNAPGNSNGESVQIINSRMRRFRYGDAQLVVDGSFSPSYFRCYTHGDMNGVSDMIVYNPACTLFSPPPSPLPPSPPPIPPQVQYTESPYDNCDILLTQSECQSIADFNGRSMTVINTLSVAPACYLQTYNNIYFFNEALTSTVTCEVSDYATCLCGIASPPLSPPPPLHPPFPSQPVV